MMLLPCSKRLFAFEDGFEHLDLVDLVLTSRFHQVEKVVTQYHHVGVFSHLEGAALTLVLHELGAVDREHP